LNSNLGQFCFVFLLSLSRSENRVYLSRCVQVAGVVWRAAMRIVIGVGDLVQRTKDDRTDQVLGGRAIERSGGAVCDLHRSREDEERGFGLKTTQTVFASLALKSVVTVSSGLASKPVVTVSDGLASKPAATVSGGLTSKPVVTASPGLALKPVVGFVVEPQNQGGEGFSGLGLKTGSFGLVI
jgi:hypothetical protein